MMRSTWGALLAAAVALSLAACDGMGASPTSAPSTEPEGGAAAVQTAGPLLGRWQLVSLQEAGRPAETITEPQRFVAEFGADGRLALRADCNRCSAVFQSGEGTLAVAEAMACTKAYCASAPLDTDFARLTQQARAWRVHGDALELSSVAGTLRFVR